MKTGMIEKIFEQAYLGHVNKLQELIKSGVDVNLTNKYYSTPLMWAALGRRANSIRLLLDLGADQNAQDYHGETSLFMLEEFLDSVSKFLCIDILKEAMSKTQEGINNQLISSANIGDLESIKKLIGQGADVNFQTNCGFTALIYAVVKGHIDSVEYLIKAGADVNLPVNDGRTPLMFTWSSDYQKVVDLLLTAGADIHIKSAEGFTAITQNVMRADTVKKLIDRGGLVNEPSKCGWTALMEAVSDGFVDTVELLIKSGANLNLQYEDGRTALMVAAGYDRYKVLKILLSAGADPSIKNNEGETALDIAKKENAKKCIRLLSQASPNKK
jgi:ankyrin repeat protein